MPFIALFLFFIIFLEVSVFSLAHTTLSFYLGSENATLALLFETVLSGLLAYRIFKQHGLRSLIDLQKAGQLGSSPESILLSQLANLVGALFLLIPGILSDISGLLILYSPLKNTFFARMRTKSPQNSVFINIFQNSSNWRQEQSQQAKQKDSSSGADIIDVEAEDLTRRKSN